MIEIKKLNNRIEYHSSGQLHRDNDLPAIEWNDGTKEWYKNGKLHRVDGPAVEYVNGSKEWWVNDKCHRVDGPAIENKSGYKAWCISGLYHRIDGPAIENPDGSKFWYIEGRCYNKIEFIIIKYFNKFLNTIKK